jgi:PAT family beta-lactamase induction signal transducer AmpG
MGPNAERRHDGDARGWLTALAVYLDRRQLAIALMGFGSGLPFALAGATLSWWLSRAGIDKTSIGLFALVALPYSLKFLWAPLFDHLDAPAPFRRLGKRRGWILVVQIILIGAILLLGQSDPRGGLLTTAILALIVAFLSASQDIVVDAYRIDILEEAEQGAGAAATQTGWRIAFYWVAGAGAQALSDFTDWNFIYAVMAGCMAIAVLGTLIGPEPVRRERPGASGNVGVRLRAYVIEPFRDFMSRPGWAVILLFALLYKYGDAISGIMTNPFFVELGFTGVEVAQVAKLFGFFATIAGMALGGILVARWGSFPSLLLGGLLQAATNLLFAVQAHLGHDLGMLYVAIGADNFTGGIGSAAFVAYLSGLCSARFTATQYALLTSFMAFGRTVLSSGAGWFADQVDWVTFFTATAGMAVPGLLLLFVLRTRYPWAEQQGHRS